MVALQVLRVSGRTGLFKLMAEPGAAAVATAVLVLSGRRIKVSLSRRTNHCRRLSAVYVVAPLSTGTAIRRALPERRRRAVASVAVDMGDFL